MTDSSVTLFGALFGFFLALWFAWFVGAAALKAIERIVGGKA